jgi:hypothetical protein
MKTDIAAESNKTLRRNPTLLSIKETLSGKIRFG